MLVSDGPKGPTPVRERVKGCLGLTLRYRESGSRPLGRPDLLRFNHRQDLGRPDLLRFNHRQDQCMQVCDAFQQPGIVLSDYQRLVFFGHSKDMTCVVQYQIMYLNTDKRLVLL
jgi:hypothetical protein